MDLTILDADARALIDGGRELAMGPLDGADRFNLSEDLWAPALNSADLDILPDKALTDARVQEMIGRDGMTAAGADLYKNHIVGASFMLKAKPAWRILQAQDSRLDEVWADEFQDEVQSHFTLWAESPNCWPDAARKLTFTSMIRLAMGVQLAGGEIVASVEWLRDEPRPFHTAIQLIESERVSTPYSATDDPLVRAGIRHNRFGAPQGYYIRKAHPTDFLNPANMEWDYVEARKPWGRPQIIHLMDQTRINQSRGISKLVSSIREMKIAKKYRDVTLQNAIVNATYAATIESELPSEAVFTQIGAGKSGSIGGAAVSYAQDYLAGIAAYTANAKNLHLDGVKIPHLFPGTTLNLNRAGAPGGVGEAFEKSLLRYIAANLGVSYEEFSRDYSSSNYSSIKAAIVETQKQMQAIKKAVTDRFASIIYRLWLEEAMNAGKVASLPAGIAQTANFYAGMNADAYCNAEWVGAGRGQIDELKETQAAVLRLKYRLSTYEDEAAKLGKDYKQVFAQAEKEVEDMEARGLTVEGQDDNQMNAASGAPRESEDA